MKETGLMFKAPLVRAILSEQKTQTRRVVKPHPMTVANGKTIPWEGSPEALMRQLLAIGSKCPMGKPGDRIYVRETFNHFERNENFKEGCECFYRADGDCVDLQPWRPAIHMPKHAARIWLEIAGVRVERLQSISEADAKAEGVDAAKYHGLDRAYARAFSELWETTGGDWAANPWVWVIDFKTISTTGRPA